MDIFRALRVAIRSEAAAQRMYEKLAIEVSEPDAKMLFKFLSRYEIMHQQFLEAERKAIMASAQNDGGRPSHWIKLLEDELDDIPPDDGNPEIVTTKISLDLAAAGGIAKILQNANDELMKKQIRYEEELDIAADVQRKLLPREFPKNVDLQIAGVNIMARSVGGDFYDFITNERGQLSIAIADSMGKGMSAALLMTTVRAIWRSYFMGEGTRWPNQALSRINSITYQDLRAAEAFVTMFSAIYDPATSIIRYSSAGHNPPILRNALDKECRKLTVGGPPLGVLPNPDFPVGELPLSEGDILVLYTDGVVEAHNKKNELYGIDRLCDLVSQSPDSSAEDIKDSILAAVNSYTGNSPQGDDITIAVLRKI